MPSALSWKIHLDYIRARRLCYSALALALFFSAILAMSAKVSITGKSFNFAVSDGRSYYVYLPATLIRHDFDIAPLIKEHWRDDFMTPRQSSAEVDKILENLTLFRSPLGYVKNKYPVGLALTLAPGFLLGHIVALSLGNPDGYSLPYQLACLAELVFLAFLIMLFLDELLLRLGASGAVTCITVIVTFLATPLCYYTFREPLMIPLVSTFWVTLATSLAFRRDRPNACLIALALGMATVCRPSNVVFCGLLLPRSFASLRTSIVFLVLPWIPQMLWWQKTVGVPFYFSYEGESFAWGAPQLLATLFSWRHGLFTWTPLWILGLIGLWQARRSLKTEPVVIALLIGALGLWYCNSAWHCWWFGLSFGARSFTELTPLLAVGIAYALRARPKRALLFAAGAILLNIVLMGLYITHRISPDGPLFGDEAFATEESAQP